MLKCGGWYYEPLPNASALYDEHLRLLIDLEVIAADGTPKLTLKELANESEFLFVERRAYCLVTVDLGSLPSLDRPGPSDPTSRYRQEQCHGWSSLATGACRACGEPARCG
jgi:hypothetical protein